MKVATCFILLISLIVSCQANLRQRDLQGDVCNCIRAPCDCGGQEDKGLDESTFKTCPETAPFVTCINEANPVTCGTLNCMYNNDCLADGAGWNVATQCVFTEADNKCPPSDPLILCPFEDTAYTCGPNGCFYPGACLATGAGWDLKTDCVAIIEESNSCPPPDPAVFCIAMFDPVMCGECEYSNACAAAAAGYKEGACEHNGGLKPPQTICADPDTSVACAKIYGPVLCNGCQYDNQCQANAAGYTETDCDMMPIDPPSCPPTNPAVRCAQSEFAYECGTDGCFYDSMCLASSAGFNVEEECKPIVRESPEDLCPLPNPAVKCAESESAYQCGIHSCYYSSMCLATASGFNVDEECMPTKIFMTVTTTDKVVKACPAVTRKKCSKKAKKPVTCSNNEYSNCTYNNRCAAKSAGFKVKLHC